MKIRFTMSTWFLIFYERVGTVDRTAWEKLLPEVHDEG